MKNLDIERFPFFSLVAISMLTTIGHIFFQAKWPALRYGTLGTRPPLAQGFIGLEVLLLMFILTVGFANICDQNRDRSVALYAIGVLVPLGSWILASFVL